MVETPALPGRAVTSFAESTPCLSVPAPYAVPAVTAPFPKSGVVPSFRLPRLGGAIASGGGGNTGFSSAFICEDENSYDCASFRISLAASSRFASLVAISVCADFFATADASGSLRAARAASRSAWAPACVRGIEAWAEAIASEALASHFDAPSL
ncbi:hypothetical protein [Streptomyces sp. NBC_00316]|uniref:hypothetical protein n=1 Tax=Streptomyces sp. NBC_00316 TaxID=2975710 RepID=UPI002E284946|nr:hypothetical protein [Streptomyces sp. NBC_00316]